MYKANSIGIHRGRLTGNKYRFRPGQTIDAPNGDLWRLPGVQWIGDEPEQMPDFDEGVKTVYPDNMKSTDFNVKQVRKMASGMDSETLKEFTKGDTRKTVKKLL